MARKTSQLITDSKNSFQKLEQELQSAMQTRDEYNRQLRNARERLARREKSDYPNKLTAKFISDIKKGNVLYTTLVRAIDNAASENLEFGLDAYSSALYSVAEDSTIYKFFINGSGWATNLDLQIIFESTAGDLNDWAKAINDYRITVLKSKGLDSELAGEKATEFWLNKVYGTSLENKTVKGRLALAHGKAPFWRILNNGSVGLASDRPGGYNPIPAKPTDFVGDAERAIEDSFRQLLNKEYQAWFEEEKQLKEVIAEYEEKRDQYSLEVKQLRTEARLNESIYRSFDEKKKFIDRGKLARTIRSTRTGTETETVNIAASGTGERLLITVRRAEGIIEY